MTGVPYFEIFLLICKRMLLIQLVIQFNAIKYFRTKTHLFPVCIKFCLIAFMFIQKGTYKMLNKPEDFFIYVIKTLLPRPKK